LKPDFNVYYFFAGGFVPSWLLSRQEISAGAKLTYSLLAQQANSSGFAQLNFRMQGAALGEDEGQLARHLMELEEVGLIRVSRGNVHTEDVRVFFPPHHWMTGLERQPQGTTAQAVAPEAVTPARNSDGEEAAPTQTPLLSIRPASDAEAPASGREGRGRRRRKRPPQSKHSLGVCLQFVTYQKEVLHHDHIWNPVGLARHIYMSGDQDDEIDAWLAERSSNAA
jgi:hypothetical protein